MNVAMARTRKDTSRIAKAGVETGANMLGVGATAVAISGSSAPCPRELPGSPRSPGRRGRIDLSADLVLRRQLLVRRVLLGAADIQAAAALGIREGVDDLAILVARHELQRRHGAEVSQALGGIGEPLLEPCRGQEAPGIGRFLLADRGAPESVRRDDRGRSRHVPVLSCSYGSTH